MVQLLLQVLEPVLMMTFLPLNRAELGKQRFACSCPGFHYQLTLIFDRTTDGFCHINLGLAA